MSSLPSPLHLLLLLLLLLLTAVFTTSVNSTESTSAACKSSVYPKLCHALLSPLKLPANPYDYGRYSVKQALKQATHTAKLIDHYLSRKDGDQFGNDGGVLQDCRLLASLNADFLSEVQELLGRGGSVVDDDEAGVERVKALMSAVLTNQQTCYDGLEDSRMFPELHGEFENEGKIYGVSLELVTSALAESSRSRVRSVEQSAEFHGSPIAHHLLNGDTSVVWISQNVTVALDGTGNFTTIGDAVAFVPNNTKSNDSYFGILIGPGVYRENIVVPKTKKNLIVIGAGIDKTVITGSRSVMDNFSTFNSSTFAVHGDRFIAINITFENTAGPEKHQAVAVRNSADLSRFYKCKFVGYQDTLYTHSFRQVYRDCDIYGTVDFIFGNAASFFQHCKIYVRKPLPNQKNVITAQGRVWLNQTTGISIQNCTILANYDLKLDPNSTQTYLGRPWKEFSRTVFMQSYIDNIVDPSGWLEWNGTFALDTLFYGEFDNHGPGANTSQRVQWPGYAVMNASVAANFMLSNFMRDEVWFLRFSTQVG